MCVCVCVPVCVSDQFCGYVQCLVVLFAGVHWYHDVRKLDL